jgi:DNA-binding NarL/FixJ family response regulator
VYLTLNTEAKSSRIWQTRAMRLFIAEDSAMLRRKLVSLLSSLDGVEIVGQARDAREATEAICATKPHVVTLDIHMFGADGIGFLKKIKQGPGSPVVIALTNDASPTYRRNCVDAGADYFLDKTTELIKVIEIIQYLSQGLDSKMT